MDHCRCGLKRVRPLVPIKSIILSLHAHTCMCRSSDRHCCWWSLSFPSLQLIVDTYVRLSSASFGLDLVVFRKSSRLFAGVATAGKGRLPVQPVYAYSNSEFIITNYVQPVSLFEYSNDPFQFLQIDSITWLVCMFITWLGQCDPTKWGQNMIRFGHTQSPDLIAAALHSPSTEWGCFLFLKLIITYNLQRRNTFYSST